MLITQHCRKILICTVLLTMASATIAAENPPPNAADLYRKAIKLYQPDQKTRNTIYDLINGEKEDYQTVKEHIKANQKVIDIALEASKAENCDWNFILHGYDPADPNIVAKELELLHETSRAMKNIVRLMLADAKVCAHESDINEAIQKIMTSYSVSRDIDSNYVLGWLSAIAVQGQTDHLLIWILSENKLNVSTLNDIKRGLNLHKNLRKPFTTTFDHETQFHYVGLSNVNLVYIKQEFDRAWNNIFDDPNMIDEIFESREKAYNTFDRNYFQRHNQELRKAINMPYQKAIASFEEIGETLIADAIDFGSAEHKTPKNYTAFIMAIASYPPWLWSMNYQSDLRKRTGTNAILTAIEIYKTKAKTGKLPDQIPLRSPKDLFSGKDFTYKKTADGFILRSTGKNPYKKDEFFKWEFKTAK